MNDVDELIGHIERQIETLCNRMTEPITSKSAADINDVARKHWESNVAILDKLYQVRAKRFGIIVPDPKADTAVIPPETIAKANAPNDMRVVIETKDTPDGFQMNVRTHERGTGYPITESDESKRIAEAVASTPHTC